MIVPSTLAQAEAECVTRGLGPSACAELMAPFCDGDIWLSAGAPPRCLAAGADERKARVLAAEHDAAGGAAETKTPPILWWIGGAVVVGLVWAVAR